MLGVSDAESSTRDRGAAAVEFAIILPLLLLVLGGIVDFGRAYFTQVTLTNAAREGARAAIVGAAYGPRAVAAANTVPGVTVSAVPAGGCPSSGGGPITVTVSAPFDWIILEPILNFVGAASALPDPLTSSATMECGG